MKTKNTNSSENKGNLPIDKVLSEIGMATLRQSYVLAEWYKELKKQQSKKEINIALFPIWNLLDDVNKSCKKHGWKGIEFE